MRVKLLSNAVIMPTKGSEQAGAFDIYMPEDGSTDGVTPTVVGLGFATEVPNGNIALVLPRSGVGTKIGVELHNTAGVIDSDYRGEWRLSIRTKNGMPFTWLAGERLFQFLILPITQVVLELTESLSDTPRNTGGFGSSGK